MLATYDFTRDQQIWKEKVPLVCLSFALFLYYLTEVYDILVCFLFFSHAALRYYSGSMVLLGATCRIYSLRQFSGVQRRRYRHNEDESRMTKRIRRHFFGTQNYKINGVCNNFSNSVTCLASFIRQVIVLLWNSYIGEQLLA